MSRARKQHRFHSALRVSYREATALEPSLGTCTNVSPDGMFIETSRPAARGVLLRFECVRNHPPGVIRGTGRVMWLRNRDDEQGRAGMGVKFVRLEPGSARIVEELIARAEPMSSARGSAEGPEARTHNSEPAVVLTAERAIGPPPKPSPLPPAGLRAPTLRGVRAQNGEHDGAADYASARSANPTPAMAWPAVDPALRPLGGNGAAQAKAPSSDRPKPSSDRPEVTPTLRERLDRARRSDPGPAARPTAPDGSSAPPATASTSNSTPAVLKQTMLNASPPPPRPDGSAQDRKPGSNPPPGPWRSRQSERPPEPGGVEVVRTARVGEAVGSTPSPQPNHWPAAAPIPAEHREREPASSPGTAHAHAEPVAPFTSSPEAPRQPSVGRHESAEDATWERASSIDADFDYPGAASAATDARYVLPDLSGSAKRRNWIPWTIVGSGVVVSLVLGVLFGRPPRGIPEEARAALKTAPTPENTFVPPNALVPEPEKPTAPITNVILDVRVEPTGAKVQVGDQAVTSPARVVLELPSVSWPLLLKAEAEGHQPLEVSLPRHAFSPDPEGLVYRMTDRLAKLEPAATEPVAETAPADKPKDSRKRTQGSSTKPVVAADPAAPAAPTEPAAQAPAENALDQALACLSRGDNACVLAALANARGPRELDLLIETHRAVGNSAAAEKTMARYLELHPDGRRASQYRRALGIEAPPSTPAPAQSPAPAPP